MRRVLEILILSGILSLAAGAAPGRAAAAGDARKEIEAFNQKFLDVTLRMDNAGTMDLWSDEGVTLLPGMAPIEGKKPIAKWLDEVTSRMAGYRVTKQVNDFHDIQVRGDWACEWGTTYQVVQPPEGKPPIEIHGKILLVLRREKDGAWRIREEMWNAGARP